jgi:sarcosine oxidase delta subunit
MKMNLIECPFCGNRAYSFKERAACSVCDCRWDLKDFNQQQNDLKGAHNGNQEENTKT